MRYISCFRIFILGHLILYKQLFEQCFNVRSYSLRRTHEHTMKASIGICTYIHYLHTLSHKHMLTHNQCTKVLFLYHESISYGHTS